MNSRPIVVAVIAAGALTGCSSAGHPPASAPTTATAPPTTLAASPPTAATTTQPAPTSAPPPAVSAAHPCAAAAAPMRYQHVVWIVMENRGSAQVYGSPSAPYLDGLAAACGTAVDYAGVAHPSLPNYIALTSGSTHEIADDGGQAEHPLSGPSIFSLLGTGWRSLEESMPSSCDRAAGGEYATKHDPAVYYTGIPPSECAAQDVPMDDAAPDISAAFTFITPNLCDDGHDCSTATADGWLAREVPLILGSPEYRAGGTAVFITWDESDSGGSLVPLYVLSPSVVPGSRAAAPLSHYSLLRATEEMLGLAPLLGQAALSTDLRPAFHL